MIQTRGEKLFNLFNYSFLLIISIAFLFPFWRVVVLSLNDGIDASKGGLYWWPRDFTLDNFKVIFQRPDILDAYKITIGRTVIGTTLGTFLSAIMAYGLSKNHLRGRNIINIMLIFTMFFSGGLIPTYLLYRDLGLLNSFWVYVVPSLYAAFYIFIFRSFFRSLPAELEESAKIDGASDLVIFLRIVFPLSLPVFATMGLFVAIAHWNDYLTGVFFVTERNLVPLQTLLVRILNESTSSSSMLQGGALNLTVDIKRVTTQSVRMATLVAVALPIICVYPFLQKYFVKGIMIGSLKG